MNEKGKVVLTDFLDLIVDILGPTAKEKGYSDNIRIDDYKNELMTFTNANFPGHALGEIVYKAVRYRAKHDRMDLVKIAAWAALQYLEDINVQSP